MKWHYTLETKSLIVGRNETDDTATFTVPSLPDLTVKVDVIYDEAEKTIKLVAIDHITPVHIKPELRDVISHLDFCTDFLTKAEHPYNGLYATGEVAIEVDAHYAPVAYES